jgi:hypothetical protein
MADPIAEGRSRVTLIETSRPGGEAEQAEARAELAWINRTLAEEMRADNQRNPAQSFPEPQLFGLTVHAGEEITASTYPRESGPADAQLRDLFARVQASIDAGADRIGHGLVLAIELPDGLRQLGFRFRPSLEGLVWERQLRNGVIERYTRDDIAGMEANRRAMLDRIERLGLTIEVNPTSNLRLSGIDAADYPMARLVAERPNLRVSVNTDNPGIHATDPATELAVLAAVGDLTYAKTVSIFLEGYASRLGGRSIADAATLRGQISAEIVRTTPEGQRLDLLRLLEARYMLGNTVPDMSMSPPQFGDRLAPYLEVIIQ